MTCGIYAIVNKEDGKRYIGKSINIERRWASHLHSLRSDVRKKDCNRHLFNAFKKYGESSFYLECIEELPKNDNILSDRELFWIDHFNSVNRRCGYNLRRDSAGKCIVSDETRKLISENVIGENNPNYGNRWSDEQKSAASAKTKNNHRLGKYLSEDTKRKHSEQATKFWSENPDKKEEMKKKVSVARAKYRIAQYTKEGELIRVWNTMFDLISSNPDFFRIAIYNCMNGHKKSYKGFLWRKVI